MLCMRTTCRLHMKWELAPEDRSPETATLSEFAHIDKPLVVYGVLRYKGHPPLHPSQQVVVPV